MGEKLEILDTDGDGEINKEEVEKFVHKILKHPNPAAATAFVNMLDKDQDGLISIVEILEYIKERKELLEEEPIEAIDVSSIYYQNILYYIILYYIIQYIILF